MRQRLPFLLLALLPLAARAQDPAAFLDATDRLLRRHVSPAGVDYAALAADPLRDSATALLAGLDPSDWPPALDKAVRLNAYNLLVLDAVADRWPLASVRDVPGFFETVRHAAFGRKATLDQLEKRELLARHPDPRLHLALVCGARGCPPLRGAAYPAEGLDAALDAAVRAAVNDPGFARAEDGRALVSEIFRWYADDFGGSDRAVIAWINRYRDEPLPDGAPGYLPYDWSVNAVVRPEADAAPAPNAARYVVSSTVPRGRGEIRVFHNLYSQRTRGADGAFADRSTFSTTQISALWGVHDRFNVGLEARVRAVRNGAATEGPLAVYGAAGDASARAAVTTLGPKIRWAPVPRWSHFSIQSALWIPLGRDLTGTATEPWIDWNGPTWWTQVFQDFSLGRHGSLFTEVDLLWEDMGSADAGRINRVSTPATVIGSYLPTWRWTVYGLAGFSPYWQAEFDWFAQAGVGVKHQFTRDWEVELLYTGFTNRFLHQDMGRAQTWNVGLRFNP